MLDLYTRRFGAKPLRCDEHVISTDEKTSIQARIRKHPTTAPAPGRPARLEHEYARGDSLAYLAAWDVHRAQVFGRCEPTTGIEAFDWLVGQVMTSQPYASARRVFWIVDNGSSHRGQPSVDRLQSRRPTLRLIHLPIHASWLNQVEIYVMHRGSARLAQPHTKGTPVSSTTPARPAGAVVPAGPTAAAVRHHDAHRGVGEPHPQRLTTARGERQPAHQPH